MPPTTVPVGNNAFPVPIKWTAIPAAKYYTYVELNPSAPTIKDIKFTVIDCTSKIPSLYKFSLKPEVPSPNQISPLKQHTQK